jgi:hypothetical protein
VRTEIHEDLAKHLPHLLRNKVHKLDPLHPAGDAGTGAAAWLTCYRRALLVCALAKACFWEPRRDEVAAERRHVLARFRKKATKHLGTELAELIQGVELLLKPAQDGAHVHPFFTYTVGRAIDLGSQMVVESKLVGSTITKLVEVGRADLFRLLAEHQVQPENPEHAVALVFHAACCALAGASQHREMNAALHAALGGPDADGGWQHGRVVLQATNSSKRLCIPPFEVCCALADIGRRCLVDGKELPANAQQVMDALAHGVDLAEQTLVVREHDTEILDGWSNGDDPLVDASTLKSWATASVLSFAVETQRVRHGITRRAILKALYATPPWEPNWPAWLEWDSYREGNEPEEKFPILRFIHEKVVEPRVDDPGKSRSEPVVVLLFGPPGTTKTTIARAVAQGLSWPLVTLSPGNFIEQGLEKVEVQSKAVFDQLTQLSQAVVVLDECDELFRARKPSSGDSDNSDLMRTGAAFMTASMLPKLQDLHDRGRIVVFICTNFLDQMDSAMRRVGRIDHIVAVAPPDEAQRKHMIEAELRLSDPNKPARAFLDDAISTLVTETRRFIRGEVIAAARELNQAKFKTRATAEQAAREIAHRMRDSTSIATNEVLYKQFLKDKKELSEPHRKGQKDRQLPDTE